IGGTNDESGTGIAVDGAGFAFVVGQTYSSDFPTAHAYQPVSLGLTDAFLTVVGPSGAPFVSSSYLGGSRTDRAEDVAVHTDGSVVVVGQNFSWDCRVENAAQPQPGGEAFVTKFDATLMHLV